MINRLGSSNRGLRNRAEANESLLFRQEKCFAGTRHDDNLLDDVRLDPSYTRTE